MMSRFEDAPETYWHAYFGTDKDSFSGYARVVDLTKAQLLEQIVVPWRERRPFFVGSRAFRDHDSITQMKIVRTPLESAQYERRRNEQLAGSGIVTFAGVGFAAFGDGDDFTSELLASTLSSKAPKGPVGDVATLLQLCARLPHAAKPLTTRRSGRTVLSITDEYDAQDILHALIRGYFKYVVSEEPLKKLANAKSTRVDFVIEDLNTIIELKYVHGPSDQSRIVKELAEDLLFYEQWDHLKVFIYVVFNADDLHDPEALDKLSQERSANGKTYQVYVVRA